MEPIWRNRKCVGCPTGHLNRRSKSGAHDEIPPVQLEIYGGGGFTYGAVLYRAGNWAEAARKLEQSALRSTGYRQAWCWLFLAISHARMGQGATGREFLERARSWIRQSGWDELGGPEWAEHVELQTLHGEAEELLKEPRRGAKRYAFVTVAAIAGPSPWPVPSRRPAFRRAYRR